MSPAQPRGVPASGLLPAPSGPHSVGRTALDLVDTGRDDPFARRRARHRRLTVWVWYPALSSGGHPAPYLPGLWRSTTAIYGIRARRVRCHARDSALPANSDPGGTLPLLMFSPGVNAPFVYSGLLEELASHGYVVAAVCHTYQTIPVTVPVHGWPRLFRRASVAGALGASGSRPFAQDLAERGAVVQVDTDDLVFVARALRTRRQAAWGDVDPASWAALGHSFGGAAATRACSADESCVAAVSIDGGLWQEPANVAAGGPTLQIFAEHPEYTISPAEAVARNFYVNEDYARAERPVTIGAWEALHRAATPGYSALIRQATHVSFSDWPMLPTWGWAPARRALGGVVGSHICHSTRHAVLRFLDRHLRGLDVDVPSALTAQPALRVESPAALFAQHVEQTIHTRSEE
jgi:dienelactone hydrolase